MVNDKRRPLVTFYVMAYNQERFIREAVDGALRQTYSPMEVVLSDDCSTDATFSIILEMVLGYSGPHRIILNRNPRNLGISEHLNRILQLTSGELIVAADGDDVSLPERTTRFVEAWLQHGKPAALVSGVSFIDASGNRTRDGESFARYHPVDVESRDASLLRFAKESRPMLSTCCAAFSRELCDAFGPLPRDIWIEDSIISLRAWLFDRIVYIPDALVNYREHTSNITNRQAPRETQDARHQAEHLLRTEMLWRREALMVFGPDLELAVRKRWISGSMCAEIKRLVKDRSDRYQVIEQWWEVGWVTRLAKFLFFIGSGRLIEGRWCGPRLLPFQIFISLGATWTRWRLAIKSFIARTLSSPQPEPGMNVPGDRFVGEQFWCALRRRRSPLSRLRARRAAPLPDRANGRDVWLPGTTSRHRSEVTDTGPS
jgi:glycosyltransferase involved in cell wall biosynthesis